MIYRVFLSRDMIYFGDDPGIGPAKMVHNAPGRHFYYDGDTLEYRGKLYADDIEATNFTVQTANIADAAITSGKIDNLAVNTLKIADNAVTVPVSVDSGAFINLPPGLTVLMGGTIDAGGNGTTTGGLVTAIFTCFVKATSGWLYLSYDSTTLSSYIYSTPSIDPGNLFLPVTVAVTHSPAAGAHTYRALWSERTAAAGGGNGQIQKMHLTLIGSKR